MSGDIGVSRPGSCPGGILLRFESYRSEPFNAASPSNHFQAIASCSPGRCRKGLPRQAPESKRAGVLRQPCGSFCCVLISHCQPNELFWQQQMVACRVSLPASSLPWFSSCTPPPFPPACSHTLTWPFCCRKEKEISWWVHGDREEPQAWRKAGGPERNPGEINDCSLTSRSNCQSRWRQRVCLTEAGFRVTPSCLLPAR